MKLRKTEKFIVMNEWLDMGRVREVCLTNFNLREENRFKLKHPISGFKSTFLSKKVTFFSALVTISIETVQSWLLYDFMIGHYYRVIHVHVDKELKHSVEIVIFKIEAFVYLLSYKMLLGRQRAMIGLHATCLGVTPVLSPVQIQSESVRQSVPTR